MTPRHLRLARERWAARPATPPPEWQGAGTAPGTDALYRDGQVTWAGVLLAPTNAAVGGRGDLRVELAWSHDPLLDREPERLHLLEARFEWLRRRRSDVPVLSTLVDFAQDGRRPEGIRRLPVLLGGPVVYWHAVTTIARADLPGRCLFKPLLPVLSLPPREAPPQLPVRCLPRSWWPPELIDAWLPAGRERRGP